jgi:isoquinoline 1-oxidoreductase alpha subunit
VPEYTITVNGVPRRVDVEPDVRVLWVLRDILGITGPKYGCGIGVCRACTCHINGRAFNPCSVRIADLDPGDQITTIEGLAATVDADLHPMQQAWLEHDVAQCGFCQPGQIMAAVAKVAELRARGTQEISDADLDELRNVCRCGTYVRIRDAIRAGAARM